MRHSLSALAVLIAVALFLSAPPARASTIGASGDTSQASVTTIYSITGTPATAATTLTEDIAQLASNGPWHTNLVNNTSGGPINGELFSGTNVAVTEVLTNLGAVSWTQWTEQVLSRTTIGTPNDAPGFQFRTNTISLQRDTGPGFVALVAGTDYTLVGNFAPAPSFPDGWESFTIFLSAGAAINPGNRLRISEQVFEVFGDGNTWASGETASIAQFPGLVPEPATLGLLGIAGLTLLARRRRA